MAILKHNGKVLSISGKIATIPTITVDESFRTLWNMSSGEFTFPTGSLSETYDYYINWGDGSAEEHFTDYTRPTHTYVAGEYEISIRGTFPYFSNGHNGLPKLISIVNWGNVGFKRFANSFFGANNLVSLPNGSITGANDVTNLDECFSNCILLTSIPSGLFDNCINAAGFSNCFKNDHSLTSIPSGLFDNNINVSTFNSVFSECTSLTSIPFGLFDNNINVSSFNGIFSECTSLTSIPSGLFNNNINVTDFSSCFGGCDSLTLNPHIFYNDGEQSTRFANQSVDFSYCFPRFSWTGSTQGTAPDLWNCTYDDVYSEGCFVGDGNSTTSLSNYNDIPVGWL